MGQCASTPHADIISTDGKSKATAAETAASAEESGGLKCVPCTESSPAGLQTLDLQKQPLTATVEELDRMLDVIESEIFPKTEKSVIEEKNKVFGAAVLSKDFKETIVAETNHEMICPLFHGEIYTIVQMAKKIPASERGNVAAESVFLSTHEPCCMCISSIVWAGFQKVFYLFPYEDTTAQGIPHDVNIMHELWGVPSYQRENTFCASSCIIQQCLQVEDEVERKRLRKRVKKISSMYDDLSKVYHTEKVENYQNNLVFG